MIDNATLMEYGQEMIVIREIFDGAHELFENELERAFEYGCPTIVIEPCRLGEETARWIFFGEYLSRYSLVTGVGSILVGYFWPEKYLIHWSLLGTALLTHGIHLISWQQDVCSNYRVEKNPEQFLKSMAFSNDSSNNPSNSDDNVSLVTSTQEYGAGGGSPPLIETEDDEDGAEEEEENKNSSDEKISEPQQSTRKQPFRQAQHHQHLHQQQPRPTNPYEMIWSTSIRKNKPPVVLCRRNSEDIKRSKILNAAVSLIAIAFSFIRFVRSSFFSMNTILYPNDIRSSSSMMVNKWSFLKNFVSI